jgi:hypothetical protein
MKNRIALPRLTRMFRNEDVNRNSLKPVGVTKTSSSWDGLEYWENMLGPVVIIELKATPDP